MSNPLLYSSELPPFASFAPEQGLEALEFWLNKGREGVDQVLAEQQHDYQSLVEVQEQIDEGLQEAWGVVEHLNGVKNSPELREIYNQGQPLLSTYASELGQNRSLFEAYQGLDTSKLNDAQKAVVEQQLLSFKLSGVALGDDDRDRCKAIQVKLSELTSRFSDNVLDATMAWSKQVSEADLEGLPASALELLAQNAKSREQEGYLITLEIPSYLPVMTYAKNRELRKELYEAYCTRASECGPQAGQFDNSAVMDDILALRQELAQLLGYDSYAHLSLARKMATSPDEVITFLKTLASRSQAKAKADVEELQHHAKTKLKIPNLEAWDVMFASESLKEEQYQFSQEETKPYFPMGKVLKGMFEIVERLFGIQVKEVQDADVWHDDVRFFAIERDQKTVARFYLDPFARQHKRGGAWMGHCRQRRRWSTGEAQLPVAYLVCNFTPPVGEKPSCLTHDEVTTLFHEFGHGLHHMLTEVEEPAVSGISGVAWDAVELPSQFLENWCWEPEALPLISSHFETGEPLPEDLLNKMLSAKHFQSGMMMCRQLEFSLFDMNIHLESAKEDFKGIQACLDEVRKQVAVIMPPAFNRFQHGFSHIFAGGYAAGYYSYKWAEVLSADAFSAFEEQGIFDSATGQKFLNSILSRGGVPEAAEMFKAFRGREPSVEALLRHSGITE
jgi:oligopeptidase A